MPKIVLKKVDGTVITSIEEKTIIITGKEFGDCEICSEPMDLKKQCSDGKETLICSNTICGNELRLSHIKFFENHCS